MSATDRFEDRDSARPGASGRALTSNPVAEKAKVKRTIWWDGQQVAVIDQRYLPQRVVVQRWRTVEDVIDGIRQMQASGAPLIGVAAVHGVALAMATKPTDESLDTAIAGLMATRPTAVNLRYALERADQD